MKKHKQIKKPLPLLCYEHANAYAYAYAKAYAYANAYAKANANAYAYAYAKAYAYANAYAYAYAGKKFPEESKKLIYKGAFLKFSFQVELWGMVGRII